MHRYIPNTEQDVKDMLEVIGVSTIDDLFMDIPEELRFQGDLNFHKAYSEIEVQNIMKKLADKNSTFDEFTSFLGAGVYDHFVPAIIKHIISRSEFYTAYTPYQPEISQGTLQVIFEYQTMISDLTGMAASNASMYDGPTAAAEAALMAINNSKKGNKIVISAGLHPEIKQVLNTYLKFRDIEIIEIPLEDGTTDLEVLKSKMSNEVAGVIVQSPNFFGVIEDVASVSAIAKEHKALTIDYVDPIALGILEAPGNQGVDIVIGDGQSLGNGLNFGGPYLGFMSVTKKLIRKLPGRIVGQTEDVDGKRAFVLTLQAREQHIRRFKATSNICSNQALNALIAAIYMTTLGKQGIIEVANQSLKKAHYLHNKLVETGKFKAAFGKPFFKEFAIVTEKSPEEMNKILYEDKILGGLDLTNLGVENGMLIAVTEKRTKAEMDQFVSDMEVI